MSDNKNKKSSSTQRGRKTNKVVAPAVSALNEGLRQRLRTCIRMKNKARSGGTTQEVQEIMNRFNDNDEQKADLMREIQNDVQGMRQKDAKKYLNRVLDTMNKGDKEKFVDTMKDKLPSNQSSQLVDYVKRRNNITPSITKEKLVVNPDTVYVPTRLMSEDAKMERLKNQLPQQKKKKSFSRVTINVPKLAELRDRASGAETSGAPVIPKPRYREPRREPKKVTPPPTNPTHPTPRRRDRMKEIETLFPNTTVHSKEEQEAARLPLSQRLKCVEHFSVEKVEESMRQFMLEAAGVVEMLRVKEVRFLDIPKMMEVPETTKVVELENVPDRVSKLLLDQDVVNDEKSGYVFRKSNTQVLRIQNAYSECFTYSQKCKPIAEWIQSLKGRRIPWKWFCELVGDVGLLRQRRNETTDREWDEYFRLLCHEYKAENSSKMSVPIIPFVALTLMC
jgi:hypothetical protein